MKGTYRIIVQNKRLRYDFEIRRNLTIIRGHSASGKTMLVDMLRDYYENGPASGVQLSCEKECPVLYGKNWRINLVSMRDSIVFIDEGNEFVFTKDFAAAIQKTDNYYVIVTRESIPSLPYSVTEIYGIRNSGKYGTLKQTYNEFYHIYRADEYQRTIKPKQIITEDSHSGYQFFKAVSDAAAIECISAGGKSSIFAKIVKTGENACTNETLVIADGAAFGSEMEKLIQLMKTYKKLTLYLPESFEWLILQSGVVSDPYGEVGKSLAAPADYADSQQYFSWEQFFTSLLVNKTERTFLQYTKRSLNPAYLNGKVRDKILAVIKQIEF